MIPVNSYVVQRSIEHYGKDVQSTVCMEECAELIQAISKEKRGNSDKDHIAEEMADVIICIEMLKQIYNITEDEIYSWVITKQERIIRRIEKDKQSTKTNSERIRNMTDEEFAEFLAYNAYCEECYVKKDDSCCYPDGTCKQKHLEWLQSEAEVIELKDATEIVKNGGVDDDVCEWRYNDSEYYFESSCEHLHIFMSDGPKENEYEFCPYCGKKIKVVK